TYEPAPIRRGARLRDFWRVGQRYHSHGRTVSKRPEASNASCPRLGSCAWERGPAPPRLSTHGVEAHSVEVENFRLVGKLFDNLRFPRFTPSPPLCRTARSGSVPRGSRHLCTAARHLH